MCKNSSFPILLSLLISAPLTRAQEPTAPTTQPDAATPTASVSIPRQQQQSTHSQNAANGYFLSPNLDAAVLPRPSVKLDPQHEYTLPELIDIAEREHQETRIAWETAKNAAIGEGFARSTYLPNVTANVLGGYQGSTGSTTAFGYPLGSSGSAAGTVSALSLQWLLFDFGGRGNIVNAAQKVAQSSHITFAGAHQKVIHDVCIAYYALLAARLRVHTNEQALANAKDIQMAAESRYKEGIGTVIESTETRQLTAQFQLATIDAQGAERDAYAALLAATGLSPLENIQIAPLEHRQLSPEVLAPVEEVVKNALARRPDVLAAYASQQASEATVKAAESQDRPKIFVAGTGAYSSGELALSAIPGVGGELPTLNISGRHWSTAILAGVTIPVFDGKRRADIVEQARNDSVKAAAVLDRVRIDAAREIVVAMNALKTSVAANEAAAVLQEASKTAYDAALDAYKQGVGSVTAVIEAETKVLQANLASDDAYSSALSAAATLAFATGSLGAAPQ
jgi:outer membrane protein